MTAFPNSPTVLLQLFRYGIVGLTSNAIGYAFFLWLTYMGMGPKQAMSLLYVISTGISYWGNWRWTFTCSGNFLVTSSRFLFIHLLGYLFNFMLLLIFVDKLGYPYQWIQAIAIFIVALYLFTAFKFFVFTYPIRGLDEKMS